MNKLVKKIVQVNFILVLLLVMVISYGQILGMNVWQDDNGLFFKLAHINENAGYFGPGPFGLGPYKYTITPYIPIYKIFGYATFPYFFLNLVLYFLASICVYKVFSKIIGSKGGKVAGFLYAAGYLASDGFIRLFSSPLFSLSIILISLFLLAYWQYYKQKKIKWYFLAVLFFFLSIEFVRARTHYLIGVAISFELLFLTFRKPLKFIFQSLFRLIPFVAIFYHYFVLNADQRSGQVKVFAFSLLKGDFQQLYSLVSSWSNLILPDWFTNKLFLIGSHQLWIIVPLISILVLILLLRKNTRGIILILFFVIILGIWTLASRSIFSTQLLNLGPKEIFIAFLGGMSIIFFFAGYFAIKRYKNIYLLLLLWALLNMLAYSAYNPTVSYESVNRYLTHSFFALVGMMGIFSVNARGRIAKVTVTGLIIIWGLGNMINSAIYQNKILITRSASPRKFYQELKGYVPSIKKGDIFYFDVADNMRGYFADAFSVASMPETTAMAWRYGVDRYDFYRVTEFRDLINTIQTKNIPIKNVYTFFYSDGELINTTNSTRSFLNNGGRKAVLSGTLENDGSKDFTVNFKTPIESLVPMELEFTLVAKAVDPASLNFPYVQNGTLNVNKIAEDTDLRKLAFAYKEFMGDFYTKTSVVTSSDWQKRISFNLIDQDPDTAWQADRVLWGKEKKSSLILDLKTNQEINRFIWMNAFGNNTPIKYSISTSLDGVRWKEVKNISSFNRVDTRDLQVIEFESQKTRFVRMIIFESLNKDSPGISEVWVVPTEFVRLDINSVEKFLGSPFDYIPNQASFGETLRGVDSRGNIKISWQSNKYTGWTNQTNSKINVVYDEVERSYELVIPAGGTKITAIKFSDLQIPGKVTLNKISIRYPTLQEIKK